MPGFKNMDIDAHDGVDFVGDVSDLSRFKDCSIAEIFASNILEHFPHRDTLKVLREWHRVLEPGGKLYVSVPDFARAVELYKKFGLKDWIQNFLCGDQEYKTAFHYAIFDTDKLLDVLKHAGFSKVERIGGTFPIANPKDCSNMTSNADGRLVCLNVVVIK